MRIAVIAACPFPFPRGTPVRVLRSAQALAKLGHQVHVITYHLGSDDRGAELDGLLISRIPRVAFYKKVSPGPAFLKLTLLDPLVLYRALGIGREQKFDIIHAHHYEGLIIGLALRALLKCPLVYDAHTTLGNELPFYGPQSLRPLLRGIGAYLDRALPRRADHTVAVTEEIAEILTPHSVSCGRLSVITNGVELAHFANRQWAPKPSGDRPKRLIFTGNLSSYQGIEHLLEVFAALRQRRQDVRLRMVTNDSFAPFKDLAARLQVAAAIDVVPAEFECLPDELVTADVALNPRVSGLGIPQKLLNYMAVGMPIVSFAGTARGISQDENGLVVPNGDTGAFAAALERLLDDQDLAERLGASARASITSRGGWPAVGVELEKVFLSLLNTKS